MILADTSIWIDHLASGDATLTRLLDSGSVLGHPWVVAELALGQLGRREEILTLLSALPQATVATQVEVLNLVDSQRLYDMGIGYVDAQLLASTKLSPDALLWTDDRRLAPAASRLGRAYEPDAAQGPEA